MHEVAFDLVILLAGIWLVARPITEDLIDKLTTPSVEGQFHSFYA